MRIAVVDTGSNSTRLWIGDVEDGRVTCELVRRSTVTRLGDGVDSSGRLQDVAKQRVYATVGEYHSLIEQQGVEKALAVFTSAVRDSANGEEFAQELGKRYDLEPHILKGDDEAGLTFRGATSERDPDDATPMLVVDIGGGSTELVIGSRGEMAFHVSTQAGVVRQTERHLHTDPPTDDEQQHLAEDVAGIIEKGVPEQYRRAAQHMIAVAGTATSLAAIAQELDPYDPKKVDGYVMSRGQSSEILRKLAAIPLEERRQTKGLDPARAPTIVAGVIILLKVLDLFGLEKLEVSENDILRGAALEFAAGTDKSA
jgi:exopolyphosphatase/guanosine-5'-triphosphate,3'-diphosphate pyrophosphatase